MFRELMVERGKVVLKYQRKDKSWRAEVGGLDADNRFLLAASFKTPGQALDAARQWARQRKMSVVVTNIDFSVIGEPPEQ